MLHRRPAFALLTAVFCLAALASAQPVTGDAVPQMAALDQVMNTLMERYHIPGGALAVTNQGKLLFARGYGYADPDAGEQVQPDSLFRLADVSKSITAFTVLKLVEEGKIDLDAGAFAYVPKITALQDRRVDDRVQNITVRMLLNDTAGWDASISGDPLFRNDVVVEAAGGSTPASAEEIIGYALTRPLDFDPGSRFSYSNLGYMILGRIIEAACGMSYEQCVRTKLLIPAGIERMRVAQTAPEGRQPGEVRYFMQEGAELAASIFDFGPAQIPQPYGAYSYEQADSTDGWLASSVDVLRLLNAVDGRRGGPLLSPQSLQELTRKPAIPDYDNADHWYGMGLYAEADGSGFAWRSQGSLPGTFAYFVRYGGPWDFVVLFNQRREDSGEMYADVAATFKDAIAAISASGDLPAKDQFDSYPNVAADGPSVTSRNGVLHGGSFTPGIVSGSWLSIFGTNLASTQRIWTGADIVDGKLPESLDGVSVRINGKPGFVYYVSPTQLNVQAPSDLPEGLAVVELTRDGRSSGPVLAEVRRNAPGFLQYPADGRLFVVAVHEDATVVGDQFRVPGTRFAAPGETILLFGTGFEPSPSGIAAPPVTQVQGPITVRFGDVVALIPPGGVNLISPGLFQVNVVVPDVFEGDQEVTIEINGRRSISGVIITVGS